MVVPLKDSEQLYDKLIENQVPADMYILNGAGHMDAQIPTTASI